ncbi:aldehyde dehydrogenase family protein [Paenibacillus elgii]
MSTNLETMHNSMVHERFERLMKCVDYLKMHRKEVLDILSNISSFRAANAEIDSTIQALQGAMREVETYKPTWQNLISVFMPSNVILYSYALYLLIPSLYVRRVEFRASSHVAEYVALLHDKLEPVHQLPIHNLKVSQKVFLENSVKHADIVVFTGSYSNAEQIKKQIGKEQLYIFFGQGLNPFIIGPDADLSLASDDVIRMRLFNSGQDCLGPDIILTHRSIAEIFKELLLAKVKALVFGANDDPNANYSPIFYKDSLTAMSEYLNRNDKYIMYGGSIDFRTKKMEPTILYSDMEDDIEITEYFSPVFNVVTYLNDEQLIKRIGSSYFSERAMGCSLYGSEHLADLLRRKHTLTVNQTLEDVEQGNKAFGGYGTMSNYIFYDMQLVSKPILISEVVAEFISEKRIDV